MVNLIENKKSYCWLLALSWTCTTV